MKKLKNIIAGIFILIPLLTSAQWIDASNTTVVGLTEKNTDSIMSIDADGKFGYILKTNLSAVLNVKDFGATGDGITDDTEAIEDAFLEAKTGTKKNVYFPEGIYLISRTLYVSSDITYFGAGKNNSIIRAATTATFDTIATVENNIKDEWFYITMIATEGASWDVDVDVENVKIQNLGIDWNGVEVGDYSATPLLLGNIKNSEISDCYFFEALPQNLNNTSTRNHGSSILLAFAEDNLITRNTFLACDYENISHNYLSKGNRIEYNYFYIDKPDTFGFQAHAIQSASVNPVLLESQFGTSRTQDVFIENNTIVMLNNIANGITSHTTDGFNVKNNNITVNGVTPVVIKTFDDSRNFNVDNNTIRAYNVNGFATYGNGQFGFMAISASNHETQLDPVSIGKITNNKIHIINDSIYAGSLPSYINPIIGSNAIDSNDNLLITNNQIIIDGYDNYAKNIISVRGSYIGVIANTVELLNPLEAVTEDGINFLEIENGENVIVDNNIVNGEVGNYITETGTNSDIKVGVNSWNSLSVAWDEITGDQSDIDLSGFNNDLSLSLNDLTDVDVDGGQSNNDVLAWSSGDNYFKPVSHIGEGGSAHALATGSTAGFMSSELYDVVNGLKDFNPNSYAFVKFTQRSDLCITMNQDVLSLLSGVKTFSAGEMNAIPYYEGELYFTLDDSGSPNIGFTLQIGDEPLGAGITHSLTTKSEALIHVKFNLYFTDLNTVYSKVEYQIINMDTGENLEYKVNLPTAIDITGKTKELQLIATTSSGSGYTFCVAGGSLLKLK